MDRTRLIEATLETTAHHDGDRRLTPDDVGQLLDSVFGTVEHPGSIAEALSRGETVVLGSFGSFHSDGGAPAFHPGKALTEFLRGATG